MSYTKKMHEAARRETAGKHNIVTDLLDEIERLQKLVEFYKKLCPNISETDDKDKDCRTGYLFPYLDGS